MSDAPATTATTRGRAAIGLTRAIGGILTFLGVIGLLRTGVADLGSDATKDLAGLTVHPLTALAWLVIGLVGVAMSVGPARARVFLAAVGGLLVLWALAALLTGGDASTFLTDDTAVVTLHLVLGVAALAVAFVPAPAFLERAFARETP